MGAISSKSLVRNQLWDGLCVCEKGTNFFVLVSTHLPQYAPWLHPARYNASLIPRSFSCPSLVNKLCIVTKNTLTASCGQANFKTQPDPSQVGVETGKAERVVWSRELGREGGAKIFLMKREQNELSESKKLSGIVLV